MIRGTTAPFKFQVPYDTSTITAIVVTFSQKHWTNPGPNPIPIHKWYVRSPENGVIPEIPTRNDGFVFFDKEIHTSLAAEDTMRFSDKEKAYVQIRVQHLVDGGILTTASKPQKFTVYPVLNDEDLGLPTPSETIDDNVYIFDAGKL